MESTQAFVELIPTLGFPAVMCILLFINNQKLNDTVAENTRAIQSLSDHLESLLYKKGE